PKPVDGVGRNPSALGSRQLLTPQGSMDTTVSSAPPNPAVSGICLMGCPDRLDANGRMASREPASRACARAWPRRAQVLPGTADPGRGSLDGTSADTQDPAG